MISTLAEKAAVHMLALGEISYQEKDLYAYGFFMLFSRVFFFLLTLVYGALLKNLLESVLFFLLFFVLRAYAGGVHAAKESTCTIYTSLTLLFFSVGMRICRELSLVTAPLTLLVLGVILIFLLSPLDTEAKRLTREEKKLYHKKSSVFSVIILIVALTALELGRPRLFYPCAASIALEAVLLVCGKTADALRVYRS